MEGVDQFLHALRTGQSGVKAAFGKDLFEFLSDEPVHGARFRCNGWHARRRRPDGRRGLRFLTLSQHSRCGRWQGRAAR